MRNQYYVQYEYMYYSSLNYRSYYVAQILDCCKTRCLTVWSCEILTFIFVLEDRERYIGQFERNANWFGFAIEATSVKTFNGNVGIVGTEQNGVQNISNKGHVRLRGVFS